MEQTNQQLNSPVLLQKVRAKAQEYLDHWQIPEAKRLADQIESKASSLAALASQNPAMHQEYQRIILQLRILSFSLYDHDACLNLIKNHFVDALRFNLDFNKLMNAKMYSIPDLVWPDFALECIKALKQNNQQIGQQSLTIKEESEPKTPIVQNWLSDYDRTFGAEKQTDLQRAQYLSQNPNARQLSDQEKQWLGLLLRFYDNLKPLPLAALGRTAASPSAQNQPVSSLEPPIVPSAPVAPRATAEPQPTRPIEAAPVPEPRPAPSQPKTNGNIVDLKNL